MANDATTAASRAVKSKLIIHMPWIIRYGNMKGDARAREAATRAIYMRESYIYAFCAYIFTRDIFDI